MGNKISQQSSSEIGNNQAFGDFGHFDMKRGATYVMETLNLPTGWNYIYQNRDIMLLVDQYGPIFAQVDPPKDNLLFRRERNEKNSPWLTWITSPEVENGTPFTNFFRPNALGRPDIVPDKTRITFSPECAEYYFEYKGLAVKTEYILPKNGCAIIAKVSCKSLSGTKHIKMTSVLNPLIRFPSAGEELPHYYTKTGAGIDKQDGKMAFWSLFYNAKSILEKRRAAGFWVSGGGLISNTYETSYEKFVGNGDFNNPEGVYKEKLRLNGEFDWGDYQEDNTTYGFPSIYAIMCNEIVLAEGKDESIIQVLTGIPLNEEYLLPEPAIAKKALRYFEPGIFEKEKQNVKTAYETLFEKRKMKTENAFLDYYVNTWLALQMDWAGSLDRGWGSDMRGVRDCSNDFMGLLGIDPDWSRKMLLLLVECQRRDGWFPRQVSSSGRKGNHDLRDFVDGGAFATEFLYHYITYTGDTEVLFEKLPWLDCDEENTIFEHFISAMDYYLCNENIGEHGLCKIRGGDWLDAVNRAGLLGRGETVMVSCQVVMAMVWMREIIESLIQRSDLPDIAGCISKEFNTVTDYSSLLLLYKEKQIELSHNLRKYAVNPSGYFNSVFNDDGHWIFSDQDPDGEKRFYGPANYFAIASGVALPEFQESIMKHVEGLKCKPGYMLYWPPLGLKQIPRVGRAGSGDALPGRGENGTPYNHGAHGFLGRAQAVLGDGDSLYNTLLCLLPFDQEKHPTNEAMRPPYAVVNTWYQVPGYRNRAAEPFSTGSIAMGLRIVYDWMFGIKACMEGLLIDPCIPSCMEDLSADFKFRGKEFRIVISNKNGKCIIPKKVTVNGIPTDKWRTDPFNGRKQWVITEKLLKEASDENNRITQILVEM